jgi:hypothetical protein
MAAFSNCLFLALFHRGKIGAVDTPDSCPSRQSDNIKSTLLELLGSIDLGSIPLALVSCIADLQLTSDRMLSRLNLSFLRLYMLVANMANCICTFQDINQDVNASASPLCRF